MKRINKKVLSVLIISAITLAIPGISVAQKDKGINHKDKTIRLAVAGVMTGAWAAYGANAFNGASLAVEEMNAAGGIQQGKLKGYKFVLEKFDDRGDPKEAANVAQKVVISDVFAVVGHINSSCVGSSMPIYERGKMISFSGYASSAEITKRGFKYFFRTCPTIEADMKAVVNDAITRFGNKVRVSEVYENTAYGQSGNLNIKKFLKEKGGELVSEDTVITGQDTDFSALLTKLSNLNPDVLVCSSTYNETGMIIKQARDKGLKFPIYATGGNAIPKLIEMMGDWKADGGKIYITDYFKVDADTPVTKNFVKKYTEKWGASPAPAEDVALTYDVVLVIKDAIERGADHETLREYLLKTHLIGTTGDIAFDEYGDVIKQTLRFVGVKGGRFVDAQ